MDFVQMLSVGICMVTLGSLFYSVKQVRFERLMCARTYKRTEELELGLRELRSNSQKMYEDFRNSSRNDSVKWATIFDESSSPSTMEPLLENSLTSDEIEF